MDERLESIIDSIQRDDLTAAARGALDSNAATLAGQPAWSEITTPHNDLRTIGIIKVHGTATTTDGNSPWSSVIKVIDLAADGGNAAYWISPEQEELVYENRLFTTDNLPFRPARCYLISNPRPNIKLIWLEDLSGADGPPFGGSQLSDIARDLGEFNGYHYSNPADLPFEPAIDSFFTRWKGASFVAALERLPEFRENEITQTIYKNASVDSMLEFYSLMERLVERLKQQRKSLNFGDSAPGNLFRSGGETVAIDWSAVTLDPPGVDVGVVIGGSMVFGRDGVDVIRNERSIYESYIEGLRSQGCDLPAEDVRRAFFGQFGLYLCITGASPVTRAEPGKFFRKEFVEKRFNTPWDDIPALLTGIVDTTPVYVEELRALLD